jgi:predicted TIM-barrel fold metal-dependent hydrolase
MLIDFHTHLLPEPLLQPHLQEWERRVGKPRYAGSLEDLFARLREGGADRFCVMPFATGPGQAGQLTRWCAELSRLEPRVVPIATFHPADADLRLQVKEAFDDLGLSGAELHCQAGQFYPDDRRLFPLYERAVADGLPVVFHASRQPLPSRYVGSEPFYQIMRRFPAMRAVVAHLGADEMETFFDLATMFDELYLDTSLVYCEQLGYEPRLERLIEFQDRIVYASGFPESGCDLRRGVDAISRLGLGPGIEAKLFGTNAARLLGLELSGMS